MSVVAPDLLTGDWLAWNGWTVRIEAPSGTLHIGAGTDYIVDEWTGLDMPGMKVTEQALPEQHGDYSIAPYHTGRTVSATGRIIFGNLWERENALKLVMAARPTQYRIVFERPGAEDLELVCAPRSFQVAYVRDRLRFGELPFQCSWQADEPRLYATFGESGTISPAAPGDGLAYPLAYPLDYGEGQEGTTLTVENRGTAPAPIVATFSGPPSGSITEMVLHNQTTGDELTLDYTLTPGHTLVVDTLAKTVLLDGMSTRFAAKRAGSDWLELEPGVNVLAYRAQGSSGSSVTLAVKSAWW